MEFELLHAKEDGSVVDGNGVLQLDAHGMHYDIAVVLPLIRHIRCGGSLDDKFKGLLPALLKLLDEPLYEVSVAEISFPATPDTISISRKQSVAISKPTDSVRALVRAITALNHQH